MKQHLTKIVLACSLFVILFSVGCNKSNTTADVFGSIKTYLPIGPIATTTAHFYSVYNTSGSTSITAVGVCWSATNQVPSISNSKTTNNIDSISFKSNITGLTANTTYYLRGYVTNSVGTAYGNTITFKTPTTTGATIGTVSTFAGSVNPGYVNATGTAAQFNNPQGVCTDAAGNVYVADAVNSVIRKITPAGVVTTLAGTGTSGYTDGAGTVAQFYAPKAVAVDASGNVYVADAGNKVIRKITSTGVVSTLAGRFAGGYVDATGTAAGFNSPSGIAVDASGNVFVADGGNNAIRKVTSAGVVTTFAGNGTQGQVDSTGTLAYLNRPVALTIDAQSNLYVVDAGNYSIRKITSSGIVSTVVGNYILKSLLFTPASICVDSKGNLYIADPNGIIYEINATTNFIIPLAGTLSSTGFNNGTGTSVIFNSPQSLAVDGSGNIFVADCYNNVIRKMTITTTP